MNEKELIDSIELIIEILDTFKKELYIDVIEDNIINLLDSVLVEVDNKQYKGIVLEIDSNEFGDVYFVKYFIPCSYYKWDEKHEFFYDVKKV